MVKRLSKEIKEENRRAWEDDNFDVLRGLLREKARTCEQFYNCLMMYKDKLLAEATVNKRWGTGLSKWVTNITVPKFWQGQNLMGVLLMELTNELLSCTDTLPMDIGNGSDLDGEELRRKRKRMRKEQTVDNVEKSETENQDQYKDGSRKGTPCGTPGDLPKTSSSTSASLSTSAYKNKGGATKEKKKKKRSRDSKAMTGEKANKDNKNSKHKNKENSGKKDTTPRRKIPDIRYFVHSVTGKRKTLETTPEKNENEKKSNT